MRYDRKIVFQNITEIYQPNGDYADAIESEHVEYASIVGTDINTQHLVYGALKEGSLTFTLQNHINYVFNRVYIDGKEYNVDARIKQRVKDAYIVSEA